MKKYILDINSKGANAQFVVTYKSGRFLRLELKRGKLSSEKQWNRLLTLVPEFQKDLTLVIEQFGPKGIAYTPAESQSKQSLFDRFNAIFMEFYQYKNGLSYNYTGIDGRATKSIIAALQKICADDAECIATWQTVFSNWDALEPFIAKQMALRQINSNLNTILRQIKNGPDQSKRQAEIFADELRKNL